MKHPKIIITGAFLLVIGGISITSLAMKDREFSPNENRYLAQAPEFSIKKFLSCEFQDNLEKYLNDQICLRDEWITTKTAIQKTCGDTDIGGAYVGKKGYDFEKITPDDVDEKLVKRNTNAVSDFFDTCSEKIDRDRLSFMLVPTAGLVLKEWMPKNAIMFDQESYMNDIEDKVSGYNVIDVRETLKDNRYDEIYYKTDHHWTTKGAVYAFEEWCKVTDHSCDGFGAYDFYEVTDQFRGSLYSKILNYDSAYDAIWKAQKRESEPGEFKVVADNKELEGFYVESKLSEKDKYAYFFGGNYGEVSIENKEQTGKGNLLVIKDSFANTFVPLIAEEYDNIYMLDLRYYNGNMQNYMEEHGITDVLVLYNISNFISDRNIYKLNM